MRKLFAVGLIGMTTMGTAFAQKGVHVVTDEAHSKVEVTIDGKLFTTYLWQDPKQEGTLKKPVLDPLIDDEGVTVTRGYPLAPLPGERVDHPHHAGLWFNYGNVNGFDFWNNSDAIKPEQRPKMGSIFEGKIVSTKSGANSGELVTTSTWITGKGDKIIEQTTRYVFSRGKGSRTIDEIVTLKALENVVFNDDKEGMLGMRVASWLESPEEKSGLFMDAAGRPTQTAGASPGASGVYETSEGVKGPAVWSTRGRWCTLTGHNKDNKVATIAIIDHPGNPGFPTYWHARGYGLFAANPLGRSIFDTKQAPFKYSIAKGDSSTFRYRVVIYSHVVDKAAMDREADAFAEKSM
jgi:hypothetical protein